MMAAVCSPETDARRRRLDELFADEPYLSATMMASRLHEREAPAAPVMREREMPELRLWSADEETRPAAIPAAQEIAATPEQEVTRVGFVVNVRRDLKGLHAEVRAEDFGDVMNCAEAARFLRVAEGTLRRLVREAGVPSARLGRSRRFRKAALLRWLRAREAGP